MQHVGHRTSDEIHQLRAEIERLTHDLAIATTVGNNIQSDNRDLRSENAGWRKAHEMDEAEIERLRGVNKTLEAALNQREAEVHKLRSALEQSQEMKP